MNRDLPRRVKQGSKASYVRRAVLNDIKLAKELVEYYDKKAELWQYGQEHVEASEDGVEGEEEAQDNVRLAPAGRGRTPTQFTHSQQHHSSLLPSST